MIRFDVIIIGAGASGLFCAMEAAKRGRKVVVFDHAAAPGRKLLASGGGRCNFSNYELNAGYFLGENPHFCKSALSRYNQWSFLELVKEYKIRFHEREHGQLFCDESAREILEMILDQCEKAGVRILTSQRIDAVERNGAGGFLLVSNQQRYFCQSLVVASGGLAMSRLGASDFGYRLAKQFGHTIVATRPGLVPLTLTAQDKENLTPLAGIALKATVRCREVAFTENLLFTHRGLSGPVILQVSNYWLAGDPITLDLLPGCDLLAELKEARKAHPQRQVKSFLQTKLPKRLVMTRLGDDLIARPLQNLSQDDLAAICHRLQQWSIRPAGSEGYKSAEVTCGGVNTDEISSKTMESRKEPGLFFIGEVLDVTGWLGGYNLQWAWSSGWCAGQFV